MKRRHTLLATLFLSQNAYAASASYGYFGISPVASSLKISSKGFESINQRLGNSTILKVNENHGAGISWGARGFYLAKNLNWISHVQVETHRHEISSKGVGALLASRVNLVNALGSVEWRLYSTKGFSPQSARGFAPLKRLYLTAGPALGVTTLDHNYHLESRLDNSEITYASHSILATLGLQASLNSALTPSLHIGLGVKAFASKATSTHAETSHFQLGGANLMYKSSELEVDKLTNSTLFQASASASLSYVL
jgi:hypothetical protein